MKKPYLSSTNELSIFLENNKDRKILILCGKKSFNDSGAKVFFEKLINNHRVKYYFKKYPYPDVDELKEIILYIKSYSPELIIAVGGGSVLDYAKVANVLFDSLNIETEIANSSYKLKKKFSQLVAIPTTAGSGAEVTANAVIYVNKVKYSVEGELIKPDLFFLLPELVFKATKKIKASAGFDAIAQSVESLISKKSNDESVKFAVESLKISLKNFIDYLNKPNIKNTSEMCLAANLSGKAISISKTTAPHAVSYPFTSLYNISHGHAVSLTLSKFLKFNYQRVTSARCNFDLKKRYETIFKLFKVADIESLDNCLLEIQKKANLENDLEKLGIIIEKDYTKILSGVNLLRLSNNPVDLNQDDLKSVLLKP